MKKKILAGLLMLVVSITSVPYVAYAQGEDIEISWESGQEDTAENEEDNIELAQNIGQDDFINYKPGTYQQIAFEVDKVQPIGLQAYKRGSLPSAFDARYLLPAVRNQGSFNTCWSFAAMAAAESGLISKQKKVNGVIIDNTIDLSEYQLARLQYFNVDDPLKNTTGDKTIGMHYGVEITGEESITSSGSYLNIGGNMMFATWIMAGWKAGADESVAPYDSIEYTDGIPSDSIAYNNKVHMQNAYWLSIEETQVIKEMIMEYGALASSYFHGDSAYNTKNSAYFSGLTRQTASLYNNFYGHGIAIVGWDDNYARENFNIGCRPKSNGAWLIRNSWGSESGEAGYFWMSYEELTLDTVALAFEFEDADNYDYNYQYDGSSGVQYISNDKEFNVANVFQVKGAGNQILQAVGIGLKSTNVSYELQIYKNPKYGDPDNGTPMLLETQKGQTVHSGYHTIKLQQPVFLEYGETFSVVFSFKKKTQVFIDYSYENGSWIRFVSNTQPGQSYMFTDSKSYDLSDKYNAVARIKAYTNEAQDYKSEIFRAEPGIDGSVQIYNKGEIIYTGTIAAPVKMEISNTTFSCDGQVNRPEVIGVYDSYGKKIPQANYNIKYSEPDSEAPGTYSVQVIFKGEYYKGSMSKDYRILINPVKNVQVFSVSADKIEIIWNRNSKADGYLVYAATKKKGPYKRIAKIKNNQTAEYTYKKLKSGKTYYFKVKSYAKGEYITYTSGFSEVLAVTTKPAKVGSLQANSGKKYVKLKWKKAAGASGYEIYVYNKSKKKYVKKATIKKAATVSKKMTALKSNTTYKYKVRAYKKVGKRYIYGAFSKVKTVKTK